MKDKALKESSQLINSIEPLFYTLIKISERHKDDQIHISITRAKELHGELSRLKRTLKNLLGNYDQTNEPSHFKHLDSMFE